MRVEFYGKKGEIDKVKEKIENYLKKLERYNVYKICVFLRNFPKECLECVYFPCNEACRVKK